MYASRAQGLVLRVRVVDANAVALTEFKELGELKDYINEFPVDPDKGNFLQIEGREESTKPYFIFDGYSVDVTIHGQPA